MDRVSTHSCPATESKPLPASWVDPLSAATTSHHQRKKSSSGAGKKDRGLARQKRNSWMRSSIVRRAATVVDEEVEALCEKSPFLNSTYAISAAPDVALFHRLEITLGERLGKGGFAEVFQVTGLDIDDDETNDEAEQKKRALRRQCQATIQSAPSGHPTFAVKFIKKKLLKNTREFQHAAIDLAVEAKYLAALSHPNIIKMRGMTVGGTSAFRAGKHDDFFILMDQMQETLDRRIQSWKRCQEEQEQQTRKQRWSPALHYEMSMKYALQIADALAYLHERAIVYR